MLEKDRGEEKKGDGGNSVDRQGKGTCREKREGKEVKER